MSMKKENKNLKRGKIQQKNKKRNSNEPRVLEFNLSKSILVLLFIGVIIGIITTARIIITMNEGRQNNALATEEGKNSERVNWVTSSDGKQVPVPKGYVASQIPGETSVNGGFVIYEDTAEGIDWNTILGTSSASTLSLDEETNVESKTETEEKKVETDDKVTSTKTESTTEAMTEKKEELNTEETPKTEKAEQINKTEETQKVEETTEVKEKKEIKETEQKDKTTQKTIEKENTEQTTEATKTESTKETQDEIEANDLNTENNLNAETTINNDEKTNKEESINKEVVTKAEEVKTTEDVKATNIEKTTNVEVEATSETKAIAEGTSINIFNLQKSTNQYVWVPVNDILRIYLVDSMGKLWGNVYDVENWIELRSEEVDQLIEFWEYKEPDVLEADADSQLQNYLYGETKYELLLEELEEFFIKTIESIKKYGGFYIGRYETGGLNGTAVVRKMDTDISYTTWYKMYKKSKTLKGENGNVITSMIWGSLWDETLRWLVESGATNSEGTTLTNLLTVEDSTTWGNYSNSTFNYIPAGSETGEAIEKKAIEESTLIPTGSSEYTKVNNIYDLAGNVFESTLEGQNSNTLWVGGIRLCRGGDYSVLRQ